MFITLMIIEVLLILLQSDLETEVFERLSSMLKVLEKKPGKEIDKDVNRVNELIKVRPHFISFMEIIFLFLFIFPNVQ